MTAFWHPFADMGAVEKAPFKIAKADGVWIEDDQGERYLDATASLWCCNIGHGRDEVADAVAEQLRKMDSYHCFGDFTHDQAERLCERVSAVAPIEGSKVFLASGGGDMIESAAKIARAYFSERGEPGRQHVIGRSNGYHGTWGFGTSVGGIEANQTGFGTIVGSASQVPHDSAEALDAEIRRLGPENVAAFFCEPVIGAGGVFLPGEGYLERVREICREHGVLFVADCVICGFGRLGTWLGVDRWDLEPDLITLAKGITGGTLPLGALVVAPHIAEPFFTGEAGAPMLRHGATYSGHPACCAAANTTLDIYERENLIERGRTLEGDLERVLRASEGHKNVGEVRAGLGMMAAVELAPDLLADDPKAPYRFAAAIREQGVVMRALLRGIAVSPPLTIEVSEIEIIGETVAKALDTL